MRRLAAGLIAAALALLFAAAPQGRAQDAPPGIGPAAATAPIDYTAWAELASRAEEAALSARASTEIFEQLRGQIAAWRARFQTATAQNASRIATLEEQIAALGPAPAEGESESEPPEIADRREELTAQLEALKAPVRRAREAFTRADGLITEIDRIIRARQTNALTELGPTPLNPAHWPAALEALRRSAEVMIGETVSKWNSSIGRGKLNRNLPVVLLYLLAAGVLLWRGRRWMERLTLRVAGDLSRRGRSVLVAAISLGQIVLPYLGILALMRGASASGMLGIRGEFLADILPWTGLIILSGLWLGGRIFPKSDSEGRIFALDADEETQGRRNFAAIGFVVAAAELVRQIAAFERYSSDVQAVLRFPLIVLAAIFVFRVGGLLRRHAVAHGGESESWAFDRLVGLIGRAAMAMAVAAPVAGAIGYMRLAGFLTYPVIQTLALFAVLLLLERLVTMLYVFVCGDKGEGDTLFPVLAGFILTLAALPLVALIWGARTADLTELWTRVNAGFTLGEARVAPVDFISFLVVLAFGIMGTRLMQGVLLSAVLPKTRIEKGGQTAIVSGLGYVGFFLAAVVAVTSTGLDLSSLAIVAGALSVGIGFGLQTIVSNFVSGIILLIERPIAEGDWIEIPGAQMGVVKRIAVRSTRIQTFDRTEVIVPNSDLIAGAVINWTRGNSLGRIIVPVGVAYGTDTRRVEEILNEIAQAHPLVMMTPPPTILFMGFGDSALNFEIRAILSDVNFILNVRSELNHEVARRLAEEGIEIPFPQRDVHIRTGGGGAIPPEQGATP